MTAPDRTPAYDPFRLWAAFAVLPFITAVLAFFAFPLVWALGGHAGRPLDSNQVAGMFAFVAGLFALVVTLVAAAPLALWRLKRGPIPLWQSMVDGLLLGNAPFVLYVVALLLPFTVVHMMMGTMSGRWLPFSELVFGTLRAVTIGSVLGTTSGAIFWFLGIRERDDRPASFLH